MNFEKFICKIDKSQEICYYFIVYVLCIEEAVIAAAFFARSKI